MATGGYDVELVEDPNVAVQIKCPICHLVLRSPLETVCCNKFICRSCSEQYQKRGKVDCFLCRKSLEFKESRAHERIINQLRVRCTHQDKGCDWQGELGELDRHLNVNPLASKRDIGCGYTDLECTICQEHYERLNSSQHRAEECPNVEIECINSNKGCNWRGKRKMLPSHISLNQRYEGCEHVEFNCIYECGSREERRKLKEHEHHCLFKKTVKENKADIQSLQSLHKELGSTLEGSIKKLQNADTALMKEVQSLKKSAITGSSLVVLIFAILLAYYHNSSPSFTASSCAEILGNNPNSPSGNYRIRNVTGHIRTVYCDMTRSCGGITGGWMRVAYLNMSHSSHQCPSGLTELTDSNVSVCAPSSDSATCSSDLFHIHSTPYSKVCGKILGGDILACNSFVERGQTGQTIPLHSNYVDGVSLTHGSSSSRSHIWTFGAGPCPCSYVPGFVGRHYFCDGGRTNNRIDYIDTIWDGENCNIDCCTVNDPPWFYREFEQSTTDDIEMRVCRNNRRGVKDVIVKVIEIYVQ